MRATCLPVGKFPSIGGVGVGVPVPIASPFMFGCCPKSISFAFFDAYRVLSTPNPSEEGNRPNGFNKESIN
jgi:hypothetical protein